MAQLRAKSMSTLLKQITSCAEEQEKEIAMLRATVQRLRTERDELLAQVRFAADQANRETRTAGSLRAQLLSRTTVAPERLDFCCDADAETTAVLPKARFAPRRRVRADDTERMVRGH
jgi:hypothetical protein